MNTLQLLCLSYSDCTIKWVSDSENHVICRLNSSQIYLKQANSNELLKLRFKNSPVSAGQYNHLAETLTMSGN